MDELVSQAGRKALAVGILVVAGFVLFKVVVGFVVAVAWVAVAVLALIGIVWALRVL